MLIGHTGQGTTDGSRRALGNVEWSQSRGSTDTHASNKAADIHDGNVAFRRRGSLEYNANGGEDSSANKAPAAAETVGEITGEEACDEAAGLEGRDDILFHHRLCIFGPVKVAKLLLGLVHTEDAADGACIPAEEHTAETGREDEREDAPPVDLVRVRFHGIVADDGPQDLD